MIKKKNAFCSAFKYQILNRDQLFNARKKLSRPSETKESLWRTCTSRLMLTTRPVPLYRSMVSWSSVSSSSKWPR
ncbi:hypothetical protein PUN28_009367 [Cardiocondyla obscurior]|uniref:Uncharacterized protein n=1 Tax=Cardiocondyla obscurior TaxID=286306 RepID=A0AAW2FTY0_9HYME